MPKKKQAWANWKNRWLMKVAGRLMEAARESNPNLKFGINLYYETVLNSSNAVAWFSQTFSEALGKNFDYYALMAYHRPMKESNMEERKAIGLMAEVAGNAIQRVKDPSQVLMKIQIFDWKTSEVLPTERGRRGGNRNSKSWGSQFGFRSLYESIPPPGFKGEVGSVSINKWEVSL